MTNELTTTETMGFLERATRDPSLDVAKIEQLIALQERLLDREAKRQFAEAMNALQIEMPQIKKDRANPHMHSRYATYESIDAILRPLYSKHGFSVRFTTRGQGNRIRVGCTVSHVGGHSQSEVELESGPDVAGARGTANKTEVQGVGSIVTYLKRYTLMAAFAVAVQDDETDDDGTGSRKKTNGKEPPPPDRWELWLDKLEAEASLVPVEDTQAWDKLWARQTVVDGSAQLKGDQLARFEDIKTIQSKRVFPGYEEETL